MSTLPSVFLVLRSWMSRSYTSSLSLHTCVVGLQLLLPSIAFLTSFPAMSVMNMGPFLSGDGVTDGIWTTQSITYVLPVWRGTPYFGSHVTAVPEWAVCWPMDWSSWWCWWSELATAVTGPHFPYISVDLVARTQSKQTTQPNHWIFDVARRMTDLST
jgi:hypothetical protein